MINKEIEAINKLKILASISGPIKKSAYIIDNSDDEIFLYLIEFLLNIYKKTGIGRKKIDKNIGIKISSICNLSLVSLLEYLVINKTGSDNDIHVALELIEKYKIHGFEDIKTLKDIICKNFKLGISASAYNEIKRYHVESYGNDKMNFIQIFDCQKANKYKDKIDKVIGKMFSIMPKIDGNRIIIFIENIDNNYDIKYYTRNGLEMTGLNEITKSLLSLCKDINLQSDIVLDGELLAKNPEKLKSKDLFKKTMKLARIKGDKKDLEFHIFDLIELNAFKNGIYEKTFIDRRNMLEILYSRVLNDSNMNEFLKLVPILYSGDDIKEVDKYLNLAIDNELEGIMVALNDAPYMCKRTDNLLKVKTFETVDLLCTGVYEGNGDFEGTLGGIFVEYKGFIVRVGGGFKVVYDKNEELNDRERNPIRDDIWDNPHMIIGKIVEIQYFEGSSNQKGELSLRFPSFLGIRLDKNEPSYS